ncbi:hypothetical protein DDB_G0285255 [Dictyostelium discoideum AX4]|uniref:Uncharacterized protein n=1 Tax=Dictyostelium discoideum TaxID=44689 RepID=Q54NH5_DICDI|nr:hypothetical protein DDB_G0285255 [Dictyostelium discoideum AX4]EAL64791.1 hypothetical protein DDB_G0285255 [Dictyostelium discoideum AX4]|eukprot:XP_638294.1 hypothetical protein DDB_G0285255 [Dictyostelium discoideum AX4]
MKLVNIFIMLVIFLITFSVYNKIYPNNSNTSSSSSSSSSKYEDFQINKEIKNQDYCRIESMDFSKLNEELIIENRGIADIIVGDKDIENINYIGLDSFKCSLGFNGIYLTPSNIWNVIILGLNKLVNPMKYSSLINEKDQTLILQNSIFKNNNNNNNDQIEKILIEEISKKINPTFKQLLIPKFESSTLKDGLIFLTNAIGKRNGVYDYGMIDCKVPSCYVNESLPKDIQILGNIEDYEKMLINIKSIYDLLYEDFNLDDTSFKLFEWYGKNTFIIESIIKYMRDKSFKNMDLYYFINKFHSSNSLNGFLNDARGFSYIPIEIVNGTDLVYPTGTKINLFAGHFASNILLPKSIHGGLAIVEPTINWVITKYRMFSSII